MKKPCTYKCHLLFLFLLTTIFSQTMGQPIKNEFLPHHEHQENSTLFIGPNPTTGEVSMKCDALEGKESYLTVLDISGRTVLERYIKRFPEDGRISIDLSEFAAGIYIIRINAAHLKVSAKLIRI